MEFLSLDAVSFNQMIVTAALGLFVTMIFLSIYIRIQRQYRGRNTLPNHTQKKRVFGKARTRDPNLPSIPTENHEVVTGARPKAPRKFDIEEFIFDFDVPERPSGPVEHVATGGKESSAPNGRWEPPVHDSEKAASVANGNGSDWSDYDESLDVENVDLHSVEDGPTHESLANGVDENTDHSNSESDVTASWESGDDKVFNLDESELESEEDANDDGLVDSEFVQYDYQYNEYERIDEIDPTSSLDEYGSTDAYLTDDDVPAGNYEDQEEEQPVDPEGDEVVVPFDHRTVEAKRVGTPAEETNRSFSVVSVCLISDDEGQIYRDIRGEYLNAFLNNRGFIYLDEEYHLKDKSTVERGAIRVRNYEAMAVGTLVRENQETCGFRLYFRPRDCADALATLNEMLKIANLAKSFFSDVCAKPLRIYDGRKDSTGRISPFTQEDYNALKRDLIVAFPRSPEAASKRTAVTRNEYAPSEDLPTRAEQF